MLPHAVDLALACIVAEAAVLFWLARRGGDAVFTRALPTLGAGFALLLALRVALASLPVPDSPALLILPALALAGVCHALDLARLLKADGRKRA